MQQYLQKIGNGGGGVVSEDFELIKIWKAWAVFSKNPEIQRLCQTFSTKSHKFALANNR